MVEYPVGIRPRVLLLSLEVGRFPYTSNSISILANCSVYIIVLFNTLFEILAITMREKIIEGKKRNEEVTSFLFADDMVLHLTESQILSENLFYVS